jgi:hypothetical protein
MDDSHPPGSPPFKPKKLTKKEPRPARRESPSKPGAAPGPQLPADPLASASDSRGSKELASRYADARLTETPWADLLAPLISEHLPAPTLEKGLDPKSISLKRAREGMDVLIPSSDCLLPGDTLYLMWGGQCFDPHTIDEDSIKRTVLATALVTHSPTSFLRQGHVKVCYDIYRNGQRIGTSAILDVYLHDSYTPGEKQEKRKKLVLRKQRRRPPKTMI